MASIRTQGSKLPFFLVALILSSSGLSQRASAGQINFDDVPSGTIIDTYYPGVTFGCVACASGHAYARDMNAFGSSTAASEPNVITLVPPFSASDPNSSVLTSFNASYGAVSVFFATPQRTVSIQARPQLPLEFLGSALNKPFMEAYSSTNQTAATFLGRVLYPLNFGSPGYCSPDVSACGGPFQTLTFSSATDNIMSLRLSSQISQGGPSVYADFDNLTFQASPPVVVPAPEATFCADFNSGIPPGMTLFGQATVSGGFLKLTPAQEGQFGIAYLNDFNGGHLVNAFRATFNAALFGSTCCGDGVFPADGFSFNLVPAATVLANPGLGQPAEEGLSQGLAVNFDTWDNGGGEAPAVEVKWLGQVIASVPFQASQSPAGARDAATASREVMINLEADGTIDVSYGGVTVLNNVQTPYRPTVIGAPQWVLGARTGSANDNHWIDDLCINTRAGARLCSDFANGVPSGTTLFGGARVDAGRLKLLSVPGDAFGIAYIDDFSGGQFVKGFRATFQAALFGSTCCNAGLSPADGFSFNLVPAATVLPNPGYDQPGEEGLEQGLAVNFDTWDNGGGEAPAIEIKWLGQIIASVPFQASQSPAGITNARAASREVVIELKANGKIDVAYGGTLVLSNVATPYDPAVIRAPKWVLGARVGLANDNYWFDDLCIDTLPAPGRQIPGLFNTGVDAQSGPLPDNAIDPHYRLLPGGAAAYAATEAGGFPIPPWIGNNSLSAWISPSLDTQAASDGAGNFNYRYETTFDLTGLNPATARLTGRWSTDNRGVDILINGLSTVQANTAEFTTWTPFQVTSGFVAGTNRLTFVVNNGSRGGVAGIDPTGLRVEVWGAAALDCGFVPASPPLSIGQQSGHVVLAWHQPGFVLQSAQNVTGPWVDLARGASGNGRDYTAMLSLSGSRRFFRLHLDCE